MGRKYSFLVFVWQALWSFAPSAIQSFHVFCAAIALIVFVVWTIAANRVRKQEPERYWPRWEILAVRNGKREALGTIIAPDWQTARKHADFFGDENENKIIRQAA